ncbi:MAG TPA: ANTAR domain-containing protein [Streptosporangiaceae bacterium]|nr:ANTAR domain-containing protein [Streptosporangiaceae bacterium]
MPGSDFTELLDIATASDARSLHQLADAAAASVPGCSAANVVMWTRGEPALLASTHPDLPRLVQVQLDAGRGPSLDALAETTGPVACPDTLTDQRWPEYSAAALVIGVRCSLTFAYLANAGAMSLTLFGARPRSVNPKHAQPADTLGALGGALLGAVSVYNDARRTASQLKDAAEARAVVDQAKGILMHALGCSADEALDRMRQTSQQKNVKAIDVAREIVASGGRPASTRSRSRAKSEGS